MNRSTRLQALASLVVERGTIEVDDIVAELGVSAATARRDLDALADQQLIQRTRGGASANPTTGDVPMRYRTGMRAPEKAAIAAFAASLVRPGEAIGLNGGTTTTAAAREIGVRIAGDPAFDLQPLTVVTNAVNIANDLTIRPQARVVVTGGVARTRSYELVGPLAELVLPAIKIDTLFLGVNAVDFEHGFYTHTEDEASINAALVRAARRTVVLADSTKLGVGAFAKICALEDVAVVVTDRRARPADLDALRAVGVAVELV